MKKILMSIAILASLIACNKEELQEQADNTPVTGKQVIYATVNTATKLAYVEGQEGGGAGLTSTWEVGDKFYAVQDGTTTVTFTLISGAGTTSGVFSAEAEGVTAETSWLAVLGGFAQVHGTEVHCGYTKQTGSLASLDDYNYITASGTGLTPNFDFANGTKLSYIIRVKLPEGVKCIEYTPSAWYKVTSSGTTTQYLNGKCTTSGATDSDFANDYGPANTSTITLKSESVAGDIVYIAFPTIDFSTEFQTWNNKQQGNLRTAVILTFLNDSSDNADKSTGWVLGQHREGGNFTTKGGMINTLDMSAVALIDRPKPSDAIQISTTDVVCQLHTALTQSTSSMDTYWAPFNLGATKISEPGYYIAFGEYWDNGSYSWGSYQQRHKPNGSYYEDIMTPPYKIGSGQNNFYSMAGSRYDAARVLWGSAWKMPHAVEVMGLYEGTKSYTVIDGVNCAVFTVGGNSVTFPATGYYKRTNDLDTGTVDFTDAAYSYVRTADKLQRTQSSNTIYRQCYSRWIGSTSAATTADPDDFTRSLGYRGYPVRAILQSSTVVGD